MSDYVPYLLTHEVGVLSYPLSKTIVRMWRFSTPEQARRSADQLYRVGKGYLDQATGPRSLEMFLRADLVRKFLQMGYTRARRYWNHSSGRKYDAQGRVRPFDRTDNDKLQSSNIFRVHWERFIQLRRYQDLKVDWQRTTREKKIETTRAALF